MKSDNLLSSLLKVASYKEFFIASSYIQHTTDRSLQYIYNNFAI